MRSGISLLVFIVAFLILSCGDKPSEPTTTPKENNYLPLKVGNQWNMVLLRSSTDTLDYLQKEIAGTLTWKGRTYYQVEEKVSGQTGYLGKRDGIYFSLDISGSDTSETVMFIENKEVGYELINAEIEDPFLGGTTTILNYIAGRLDEMVVRGTTYKDVLHIHSKITTKADGNETTLIDSHEYYANNIGLIYGEITENFGVPPSIKLSSPLNKYARGNTLKMELESYSVDQ